MQQVVNVKCPYCESQAFVYKICDMEMFLCHACQRDSNYEKVKSYGNTIKPSNNDRSSGTSIRSSLDYNAVLRHCKSLDSLPSSHHCIEYVRNRGIPSSLYVDLFWTDNFREIGLQTGNQLSKRDKSERLVIPIRDDKGALYGVQGRALDDNELRYITLYFNDKERLYGMNKVDMTKPFNVVEGPIDSFFVNNCVALCGTNNLDDKYSTLATVILDNEPRNKQIVEKISKYIDRQFKVVIWPDHLKQKDINEMYLAGIDTNTVISNNTYNGITAKIRLNAWKKIK
jgi:hypothetical protein